MIAPSSRKRAVGSLLGLLLLSAPSASALEVGDRAPQFAARDLNGGANFSLAAYRGKVIYLDFWASWCAPCLTSLPLLEKLRKEFPARKFQILAINVDRDLAKARQSLRQHPVGYPSGTDPEGRLPGVFQLETLPTSFLIDQHGLIRHIQHGFQSSDIASLRKRIRALPGGPHA